MQKIYLTTAIPYVNASPHVGHALEFIQTDCLARFYRGMGFDVFFASGSDDNSLKNVQAAQTEGVSIKELVEKYSAQFERLKEALNISFDVFNKTSSQHHFAGAQKLWTLCKKEDIYKKKYRGLYCVGCEAFYSKTELVDGKCPEHETVPEEIEEENYFFRLSAYQKFLEERISSNKLKIIPQSRKNEVLAFIKRGLADFSISRSKERSRGWGVPVPGDPAQVIYVWFDALTTYLTALDFGTSEKLFKKYWLECKNRIHIIGKGIIRFHAIYWPAILASADLPQPTIEFVHGYVTVAGQKISKSLGNSIDPFALVEKYGVDPVRYYLLRETPAYSDGDFSEKRLVEIYNGELANGLGNLVSRIAKLAETEKLNVGIPKLDYKFWDEITDFLKNFEFDTAIKLIWEKISDCDKYLNAKQPWKLTGAGKQIIIADAIGQLVKIGYNLQPFLPETAETILNQFKNQIKSTQALFPRIS